jgi:hypothetical protein
MAKTIGQLTQATTLASGDEFVIEQSGLTKRVAASVVRGGLVNADIDAAAAIAGSKLADGGIVTAKIADANVTTAKIADANVTTAKIADDAVTNDKLSLAANAGEIKKALNADNSPPIFACRAWVNFDGTKDTTGAASTANTNRLIRASGNVASVLRNGAGNYTVTFTTAMPDANYVITGSTDYVGITVNTGLVAQNNLNLAASFQVLATAYDGSLLDSESVQLAIFR